MKALKCLSNRDALLVAQIKHFEVKVQRDMGVYQELLRLNLAMAEALAPHKRHHDLVQQWSQLARQLIAEA